MSNDNILSEIKDSIKERFSSPIIGTFIITFLVFNWKIPVGFFMSKEMLQHAGYSDYYEMIEKNASFFYPVITTLAYLLLYPWLKNIVKNWSELAKRIIEQQRLKTKIYKDEVYSKVDYEKLQQVNREQQNRIDSLEIDKATHQKNTKELHEKLSLTEKVDRGNYLNGTWVTTEGFVDLNIPPSSKQKSESFNLTIINLEICLLKGNEEKVKIGQIKSQSFSPSNNEICLLVNSSGKHLGIPYFFYRFRIQESSGKLQLNGREYLNQETRDIEYNLRQL